MCRSRTQISEFDLLWDRLHLKKIVFSVFQRIGTNVATKTCCLCVFICDLNTVVTSAHCKEDRHDGQ